MDIEPQPGAGRTQRWRPALELAVMVGLLQLDAWWADVGASEVTSNLLKAAVPLVWWVSHRRRARQGSTLPPATVGRGRAWLEAALTTLVVAGAIALVGALVREPYDVLRYPLDESAWDQTEWISSRLGRALFQQAGLQLFVWPVARELLGGGRRAVALSAVVFALLHVPYRLLVLTTFGLGWAWVDLYRRGRSLAAVILSHAVLAMVVFATLPDWVNHNLHVGRFEVERAPAYRELARPETRRLLREVTSEAYWLRSGGEPRAWVSAAFQDLLGRRPDPSELDAWSRRLANADRTECAKEIVLLGLGGNGGQAIYDLVLRGGTLYDGSGGPPIVGDLAIVGDRIAAVGTDVGGRGRQEIDVAGKAVSPGFINMLSWATVSLLEDPRALSDLVQGVTLEVFGEGWSMGPLDAEMKREMTERQGDIRFDVEWTTLAEYLEGLEERGVAPNVASFVGATTVRIHEIGYEDRAATPAELERMRGLVASAMEEGALGVGSSLIYAPAYYADTQELVALAEVAASYGGMYISHVRNEADKLLESIDELIEIARRSGARSEIYHFKASRPENWELLEPAIEKIEAARAEGLPITADMYTYPASATGLNAPMPPWVQEGGHEAWVERLKDPEIRRRLAGEMTLISPDKILLVGFRNPEMKHLTGKTLAEVAEARGTSPEETAMDLVIEDDSRVGTIYFSMSEDNVRRKVGLPWMSFGSDAGAPAPEGVFLESSSHPRAYGTFARLLGRYVRDEGLVPLEEAIRRLTALPAANLGLTDRGTLAPGAFADVVVFDPGTIQDLASFEDPHRLATGVAHVFVNGVQVLADGRHTGELPGRVVRGPGWSR